MLVAANTKTEVTLSPDPRTPWSSLVSPAFAEPRVASEGLIGVLEGEGIGPEVVGAALDVLAAVQSACRVAIRIERGACIGLPAQKIHGHPLSQEVATFCEHVFGHRGAILAGPGGGRFVYDMRKRFDLFCKLSPLVVHDELLEAGHLQPEQCRGVDIVVVRENCSGIYQGSWYEEKTPTGERRAVHEFSYDESAVSRIIEVGARIASERSGRLAVIHKLSGIPTVSRLWIDVAQEVASAHNLDLVLLEVDYAAYALVQHPRMFDVIITPNLFGDIISDLGGVLLGSRGACFSGNFAAGGMAVYQTNHGAAHDLAGRDVANPAGQILSVAMLLRQSFGYEDAADLMERSLKVAWARGFRTADIATAAHVPLGTREMGHRVAEIAEELGSARR